MSSKYFFKYFGGQKRPFIYDLFFFYSINLGCFCSPDPNILEEKKLRPLISAKTNKFSD